MNQRLTINVYFCYAAPPDETPSPSLPTLPLMKSVYPVPPPPPQVFIIKENSASSKDPEDRKSAEALDNLSKTFEDAFTEAYKSERKTDRLQDTPRRERFRQRLHEQDVSDSDSDEPRWGRFRQREHEQDKLHSDSHEHHRKRFRQREREEDRSDSNVDSDDEVVANSEDEEDEERMRSSVGSRRDFRDHNATEDTETSEENEINNKSDDDDNDKNDIIDNDDDDNDDDNNDDDNNDDGHDDDNDDNNENKDSDSALDTEPSSDADEPRHSHSQQYHSRWDRTRHRVEKGKNIGLEDHDKGSQHGRFHLSLEMRNRFAKHQRVRQHSHKKKYRKLKNKKRKELSRKQVFDPSGTENFQRKLPKAILRPGEHRKDKTTTAKDVNVKHRLGTHYNATEKSQLPTSHDRSNFAHLQDNDSGKYRQDSRQRHIHHYKKHSQQKSLRRGRQDGNQNGHRYNQEKHIHPGNHFNTETDLSGDDISESSSSFEGSASIRDEASTSMKYDETISSSNYGRVNHDIPAKNGDDKKHVKTLSNYAQSLKPRARHVSLKHEDVKSYQNDREDTYYNSGEESGDSDFSETEGSNYEYFIQNWLY